MSTDFDITPPSLQAASARMQQCSDDLVTALEMLKASVTGSGSPWGSEGSGSLFGDLFTVCCRAGVDSIHQLSQHLGDVADGLARMGENTRAADDHSARGFEQPR